MLSKEAISNNYGLCTCEEIYTSRGLTAPDCPWHAHAVEEAMEEYAKQHAQILEEALEFIVNNHVLGDDFGLRAHCAAALNKYRNAP